MGVALAGGADWAGGVEDAGGLEDAPGLAEGGAVPGVLEGTVWLGAAPAAGGAVCAVAGGSDAVTWKTEAAASIKKSDLLRSVTPLP